MTNEEVLTRAEEYEKLEDQKTFHKKFDEKKN